MKVDNEFDFSKSSSQNKKFDMKNFSEKKSKQELKAIAKNNKLFFAFLFAVAGLFGLHNHVEYSGWLIFFAFCML